MTEVANYKFRIAAVYFASHDDATEFALNRLRPGECESVVVEARASAGMEFSAIKTFEIRDGTVCEDGLPIVWTRKFDRHLRRYADDSFLRVDTMFSERAVFCVLDDPEYWVRYHVDRASEEEFRKMIPVLTSPLPADRIKVRRHGNWYWMLPNCTVYGVED